MYMLHNIKLLMILKFWGHGNPGPLRGKVIIIVQVNRARLCLWTAATNIIFRPLGDIWVQRAMVEWQQQGKSKNSKKNLSNSTLSATNPTLTDPWANPGLRGERPATNCMSNGGAKVGR
jgi:hypothetical protein